METSNPFRSTVSTFKRIHSSPHNNRKKKLVENSGLSIRQQYSSWNFEQNTCPNFYFLFLPFTTFLFFVLLLFESSPWKAYVRIIILDIGNFLDIGHFLDIGQLLDIRIFRHWTLWHWTPTLDLVYQLLKYVLIEEKRISNSIQNSFKI